MRVCYQVALILALFFPGFGQAQTTAKDQPKSLTNTISSKRIDLNNTKKFEFGVAPGIGAVTYTEPGVMKESGYLYGAKAYGQWMAQSILMRSDLEVMAGQLAYTGKDWSGQSKESTTQDLLTHLGAHTGYRFPLRSLDLSLSLGAHLRYWNQTLEGKGGYPRELTQVYFPVGLQLRHGESNRYDFTYRLEYAPLIYGQMFARLSKATDDAGDQVLRQSTGSQYMAAIDWRIRMNESASTLVGLYYRQTEVAKSQENKVRFNGQDLYIYEPENNTSELGLFTGLSF